MTTVTLNIIKSQVGGRGMDNNWSIIVKITIDYYTFSYLRENKILSYIVNLLHLFPQTWYFIKNRPILHKEINIRKRPEKTNRL